MKKTKIIIVCSQNSARSQMAEAFFNQYGQDILEVASAGLESTSVNPYAIQVMKEIGMDISGQRSKSVKEFLGKNAFGYVITVCKKAESRCPIIFPGVSQILSWPFDDPAAVTGTEEEKLEAFRKARNEIEMKVKDWIAANRQSLDCTEPVL